MALIVTQHWSANLISMTYEISAGDTAWVLTSAALVLLMQTPGLAFFYGGMVRAKGVLNMLMMNFVTMGTVGVRGSSLRLLDGLRQQHRRGRGQPPTSPACPAS